MLSEELTFQNISAQSKVIEGETEEEMEEETEGDLL